MCVHETGVILTGSLFTNRVAPSLEQTLPVAVQRSPFVLDEVRNLFEARVKSFLNNLFPVSLCTAHKPCRTARCCHIAAVDASMGPHVSPSARARSCSLILASRYVS